MQVGIGIRRQHYKRLLQGNFNADWFEVISENYMGYGGRPRDVLAQLKSNYPIVCHGLGLSLGSADELDWNYIQQLKELLEWTNAPWFSDHLCLSSSEGIQFHDLIPCLKTEEVIAHIIHKIQQLQQEISRPFAIENISYYMESQHHTLSEIEFIQEILKNSKAQLLLDINNVYVNSQNFGYNPKEFLRQIPHDKVIQIHLAGHEKQGDLIIDTHGSAISDPVWELYAWYLQLVGRKIPTLIEWDNHLPSFDILDLQVVKAKRLISQVLDET